MLGDEQPNAGGDGSFDPSQPLLLLVRQLETVTSATIDDPESFIDDIVQDVLDVPPEERFDRAIDLVEDRVREEFGSLDVFESKYPIAPEVAVELFEQILNEWATQIAERALQEEAHTKNALLLFLAAVDVLHDTLKIGQAVNNADTGEGDGQPASGFSEQEWRRLGSIVFSIYARLYREVKADQRGEMPNVTALATDTLYGEQALMELMEPERDQRSISELAEEERMVFAVIRGALRVYEDMDISTGRGAELVGVSQNTFVDLLEGNDMRPRYGPESIEDLYSGPDLTNE